MGDYTIRLIDRIRAGHVAQVGATFLDPAHWAASETRLQDYLQNVPRIVADNIDEFEYWHWRTPDKMRQEKLNPCDVPNLVPPFSSFWFEWRWFDPEIRRIGQRMSGCLVDCIDWEDPELTELPRKPGDRYGFSVMPFILREDQIWHCIWRAMASSDATGNLLDCWIEESPFVKGLVDDPEERPKYRQLALAHLTNVLIGVSFLNCQNVRLIDGPQPPQKLNRKHHNRTGGWLSRHKLIEITPMSRIFREAQAGDPELIGGHKALHIMRGHFKRYTEGKGLFGKLHGTFFWHQATRGSLAFGERRADYALKFTGKKHQPR